MVDGGIDGWMDRWIWIDMDGGMEGWMDIDGWIWMDV
jgi:hypothetical protein